MSTTHSGSTARSTVSGGHARDLERQQQAFVPKPTQRATRRDRIDRLLALVLDNADAFVDAMSADYGTRPKTGSLFTESSAWSR